MNCFDFLDRVESTTKLNEKVAILKEGRVADPHLSFLIERCFNYKRLYYIKDLPEATKPEAQNSDWAAEFEVILNECQKTGRTQETKQRVANWLAAQSPQMAKWCRRVVLRDLKCGVSQELALKAGFEFPTFEVMLATDGKKCKKLDQLLKRGVYVTPKLDGYRCFAIVRGGTVELYSRNGTKFENFPTIENALLKQFGWAGDRCYDGEIMSDSFNAMQQSAFAAKRGTTVGDVSYHIFGTVDIGEWDSQEFKIPYQESRQKLFELFATSPILAPEIKLVHSSPLPTNMTREGLAVVERQFIEAGYEGAICNPGDIPYYMGKHANRMFKLKEFKSWDCQVVAAWPGEAGGKRDGTLGHFTVMQENGIECDVGTGFKADELDRLWARRDEIIGRVAEIAYQELTDDGKMRFPVFKRWRPDKE